MVHLVLTKVIIWVTTKVELLLVATTPIRLALLSILFQNGFNLNLTIIKVIRNPPRVVSLIVESNLI